MARYYVPFVNLNTFIYESVGIEENIYLDTQTFMQSIEKDVNFLSSTADNIKGYDTIEISDGFFTTTEKQFFYQNTIGHGSQKNNNQILNISELENFKNYSFAQELSTTASFVTALNLKRNGPYGYPTWKQIRTHENPLTRNQRKRNIITAVPQENLILQNILTSKSSDPNTIEVFKEPVFSSREKPLIITFPKGPNIYRASFEMGSLFKYFENDRLNQLYAPFDNIDNIQSDPTLKEQFLENTFRLIGDFGVPIISIEYTHTVFPQKSSLEYDKRVRTNFYHPWKDNEEQRKAGFLIGPSDSSFLVEAGTIIQYDGRTITTSYRSRWPLDPAKDFLTSTSAREENYIFGIGGNLNQYPGILQFNGKYEKDLQAKNRNNVFFSKFPGLPRFSYNHTITPLTSCVGPHGMDIEGVNEGTLFEDLSSDHIPSGDAYWDAGSQYGTNPFYDSYEEFVYDIKKVAKDYAFVPEFRSSLYFDKLQNEEKRTPREFLEVLGGKVNKDSSDADAAFHINSINALGTTEIGHVSASSSDSDFFQIYSHSDFMRNFDVVQEVSNIKDKPLLKMSLTCKAIKKFAPYEGFYPAERTVQIAEKFRDSIIDSCYYTGSGVGNNVGDILETDSDRYVYFNNIMTPMFAPGIMFNSIKSGLAVDYPIHTSSLTLANGGVNIYDNDYYIQKPFDERIPFEALLEPNLYISNKEVHCSEPHPSGNLSGSATWDGTGDTTEYQLMLHNFLAETANFFLQDQNFSFIASKRSDEMNIALDSGSIYGFNVKLFKSQNKASDKEEQGSFVFNSLLMTGSGVQETFTMYSRPSAFGPPNRITASYSSIGEFTSSYSNAGYNWAFTPSYYDGISEATFIFNSSETRGYSLEEIFENGVFIENRILGLEGNSYMDTDMASNSGGGKPLNNNIKIAKVLEPYNSLYTEAFFDAAGYNQAINDCSHTLSSLNINLGIIKDIDLLDDDTSDTVKVAVDISSDKKSQIIIQPKWETPMFNFQAYSDSDTISLPLVGSQSVPRGIWHQYGTIETDPKKGIFMQVGKPNESFLLKGWTDTLNIPLVDLSQKIGLPTEPVKLGKTASKKVVREAIVAVPFYEYTPDARIVEQERKFLEIPRAVIQDAIEGKGKQNVIDMVNKMQRFVMPPMFNFLEDQDIDPITMYMFDFKHTFDQEDLGAIWQNLPPKLMTEFQTEEKTISHTFEEDDLLSLAAMEEVGEPQEIMKRLRWMVFKVKQKAEQNYYNKIVGETQKLNKTSPYSHNWPYDYFSLVELAKIETKVDFADPPQEAPEEIVTAIPNVGKVVVPPGPSVEVTPAPSRRGLLGDVKPIPNNKSNKRSSIPVERKVEITPKKPQDSKETLSITQPTPSTRTEERRSDVRTPSTRTEQQPQPTKRKDNKRPTTRGSGGSKGRVPSNPPKTQVKRAKAKRKAGKNNIRGTKK